MRTGLIVTFLTGWIFVTFVGCHSDKPMFEDPNSSVSVLYIDALQKKISHEIPRTYVGKPVGFEVRFQNKTNEPMIVTGVQFSCGCAQFEPKENSKYPIALDSRETLEFFGKIDTNSRDPGLHVFPATVQYRLGADSRYINLDLKVKCEKRVTAIPSVLHLESSKRIDDAKTKLIVNYEIHDPAVDVAKVSIHPVDRRIKARRVSEGPDGLDSRNASFELTLVEEDNAPSIYGVCELKLGDEILHILPVHVRASDESIQFSPTEVFLNRGTMRKVLFKGSGLATLRLEKHPDWIDVQIQKRSPELFVATITLKETKSTEISINTKDEIVFLYDEGKKLTIPISFLN